MTTSRPPLAVSARCRWYLLCTCGDTTPQPVQAAWLAQARASTCTEMARRGHPLDGQTSDEMRDQNYVSLKIACPS